MDSRLLPLLALLGAADLKPSHWEGSSSQEPSRSPKEEHPFSGSNKPRNGGSTLNPLTSSLLATPLPPDLAMSSVDSKMSPAGGPSGATTTEDDSSAAGRTQPPNLDMGGSERTEPPNALGTSWLPRTISPSAASRFLTFFPTSALIPESTSSKEVAAPTSLSSEGFSHSGSERKTLQGWSTTAHQDTWEWVSNTASGTATPRVASAQNAASNVVSVEDSTMPAVRVSWTSGAWMFQKSMTSPHTMENQGILVPTRPPVLDTSVLASTGSSTPPETRGPAGEAAIARILSTLQAQPHDRSSFVMGGSPAHVPKVTPGVDPEAKSVEQVVVVESLSSATTTTSTGHMLEVMEETVVSDCVGGCPTAAPDSHIKAHITHGVEEETLPFSLTLPSFAATSKQGADGTQVTPHLSLFSRGGTVPRRLVGSVIPPSDSDPTLHVSSSTPGPSLPPSSMGSTRLTDPTEGLGALDTEQDISLASATHQHHMDLSPDSGKGLFWGVDNHAMALGESWGAWNSPASLEVFSVPFTQSLPRLSAFPLSGMLPGSGSSATETSDTGWPSTLGGVQKAPSVPMEQLGGKGSTSDHLTSHEATDGTSMGTTSEKLHPRENPRQTPSFTGSPTISEITVFSTDWVKLNSTHAAPRPELIPSSVAVLPSSVPSTREVTTASDRLLWTLHLGSHPAGTQLWKWERDSMENSARETPTPSYNRGGPLQTTATSGSLESSWQTWPPVPAPEPGSASRSGPAIASTWLLASVPEEVPTHPAPVMPDDARNRGRHVFVAENQPPLLKAAFLRVPCELVLAMEFSRSFQNPRSAKYRGLVLSINETVAPLLASLPGFHRLEVKTIRAGSVVVEFDALFQAEASGLWVALNRSWLSERLPPGLWVADARVLRSGTLERHLDLCAMLFSCHAGYECTIGEDGDAICTSVCHRDYCQNQGICTHEANHVPVCQCPVGSDFWFLGMRCNYKVTQQGLLGVTCGLLLSLVVVGTAIATLVIRRVRMLLLEARADQTKSSYRRFCRLDDVSAHYWSEPWLASASSLDNPAFSNSEELLHLQILDTNCSCPDNCMDPSGSCKQLQDTPCDSAAGRPSFHYNWDISSNSVNDPMIDSGKASEVSISSWPLEPIQWSPFPALHKLSGQQVDQFRRPHSYCEGMELVNLERSWTA